MTLAQLRLGMFLYHVHLVYQYGWYTAACRELPMVGFGTTIMAAIDELLKNVYSWVAEAEEGDRLELLPKPLFS